MHTVATSPIGHAKAHNRKKLLSCHTLSLSLFLFKFITLLSFSDDEQQQQQQVVDRKTAL